MPSDEPEVPKRKFAFKPREIEIVNPPVGAPGSEGSINVHDLFRKAAAGSTAKPSKSAETEVHQILRENLARENAAGLNDLPDRPPRRSRRKRDYWISMAAVNAIFLPVALGSMGTGNVIVFVYSVAGFAMSNAALAWIFWMILDDY